MGTLIAIQVPGTRPLWTGVSSILVRIHTAKGLTGIGASQSTPPQQAHDTLIGKGPMRRPIVRHFVGMRLASP
jgi:hypothetical protein